MTGREVFNTAASIMQEDTEDLEEFAVDCINLLIGECFDINNSMREAGGLLPYIERTKISSLDDEMPCEDHINTVVMPYGLAAKLLIDDMDSSNKMKYFESKYIDALENSKKYCVRTVEDSYYCAYKGDEWY